MKRAMWRGCTILLAMALVTEVSVHDFKNKLRPYSGDRISPGGRRYIATISNEEYMRHIHSIIDAHRGCRLVVETNALINKRNADIINSLLALPKGMNDAGR